MITEQELDSLKSFGKESFGKYSDRWKFAIIKIGVNWYLFFSGETEDEEYPIKRLKSMEDLKNLYKAITDEELE